ncbi:response regulator, partial [bacterium]|nr:response regulator [bacterium]
MNDVILLVEDDKRYGTRLKKNLELEGYTVLFETTGNDALQTYMRESVDLVLTDIKMPGMDGLELLNQIMELQAGEEPDVPVIVLTSVESVRVAVDAMKAGAADYITKDADRDEIILRLDKVLSGARVRAENRSLKKHLQSTTEVDRFIAESPVMKGLLNEIED